MSSTNTFLKVILAGAVLAGFSLMPGHAQTLVTYSVDTNDDSHPGNAGDPRSNANDGILPAQQTTSNALLAPATSVTYGSGLNPNNFPFGLTYFTGGPAQFATTLAGSISANEYIGFTITPTTGVSLNLTSLDLSNFEIETTDGNPQTYSFVVESSVGGFSDTAALSTVAYSAPTFGTNLALGSAFSDLTSATSFRIYLVGGAGDDNYQTTNILDGSTIALNGTASVAPAVPEPSTAALMLGGLSLLFAAMRLRRSGV